jgi:hypothetical protein
MAEGLVIYNQMEGGKKYVGNFGAPNGFCFD